MAYLDGYRKRLGVDSNKTVAKVRHKSAKSTIDRNFSLEEGHMEGSFQDRTHVDNGSYNKEYIDFVMRISTNSYERYLTFRPDTVVKVGTYITTEDGETLIVRELQTKEPCPVYRAFACNQVLKLEGCPVDFPCFSFNSTYSSKGMIDIDRAYGLDSRNKLYIQKNKFSNRLLENHRGYRIRLGDEDGYYSFYITEMDDLSYKGMYVISLKIDEVHPLDKDEFSYNENQIDFSDLCGIVNGEIDTTVVPEPKLYGESYVVLGDIIEIVSDKDIMIWVESTEDLEVISKDARTFKAKAIKQGFTVLTAIDLDGKTVNKTIRIK